MSNIDVNRVRVFIGTEQKTEVARKVLQSSITYRTQARCDFIPMIGPEWEYSTAGISVGTGFSLRRWMIPAYCGWEGRAIYLDADQIMLSDIWELWTLPDRKQREGCSAWMTYQTDKTHETPAPQSSVMVIDCRAAKEQWGWQIKNVLEHLRTHFSREDYQAFMYCAWMKPKPVEIDAAWNHLMAYEKGKTKLLHFTKEPEQPWYMPSHPLAYLWKMELIRAINMLHVTAEDLKPALERWQQQEDWRKSNGLHPEYTSYIPKPPSPEKHTRKSKRPAEVPAVVPEPED